MCCRRLGSVLLDADEEEGDAFFRWRRMPRRTWSGGVADADMVRRFVKRGERGRGHVTCDGRNYSTKSYEC